MTRGWMALAVLSLVPAAVAQNDVTIRMRSVISVQPSDGAGKATVVRTVYYIHGKMQRRDSVDSNGSVSMSYVSDCEQRTGFIIDWKAREYRTVKLPRLWNQSDYESSLKEHSKEVVRVESKTVDTGERKDFLGLSAKHLITTDQRMDTHQSETSDGWYLDGERMDQHCWPRDFSPSSIYFLSDMLVSPPNIPDFHHEGPMPAGEAMQLKTTLRDLKGDPITSTRTVEEISKAPLPDSLFLVPEAFKENPQLAR